MLVWPFGPAHRSKKSHQYLKKSLQKQKQCQSNFTEIQFSEGDKKNHQNPMALQKLTAASTFVK